MKLLKNPVFAVILAIVVVFASTIINTDVKFGRKCSAVSDLFYEGVTTKGYTHPSIASHLENICGYADGLITIARNYDIDTENAEWDNELLKSSLKYTGEDMFYIRTSYGNLCTSLNALVDSLERAELSERDASGVAQYKSSIAGAQSSIGESGYNEAVREFLRRYDHFPTNVLADIANVKMPETFG